MTIEAGDVPEAALDALLETMPKHPDSLAGERMWRDDWRRALAAALSEWEGSRPREAVLTTYAGHECAWSTLGVQHRDAILGVKQTDVLQRCEGCGDIRTVTLNGTWTLEQLRAQ